MRDIKNNSIIIVPSVIKNKVIKEIKIKNAKKLIRDIDLLLKALPLEFSESMINQLNDVTNQLNNLTVDEKYLLDLTNYNKLVEAYQDFLEIESAPSNPQNPTTPPKEGLSTGALIAIICGSVVGVALVGAGCFLVIKKLKQSKGGKENEENN